MKKEDISAIAEQSRASINSQDGGNIGDAVKLAYVVGNFVRYVNNHKDKITGKDLEKALDNNRALRKVAKSVDKGLLVHFHELLELVAKNEHMASVYTAYEDLKKGSLEKRKVHRLSVLRADKNVVEEKVKGFVKSEAQRISSEAPLAKIPTSQGGGKGSKGTTSEKELPMTDPNYKPPPPPAAPPPPKEGPPPKIPTSQGGGKGSKGTTSEKGLPMTDPNYKPPPPPPPPPPPGAAAKIRTSADNPSSGEMPSNKPSSPSELEGAHRLAGAADIGSVKLRKLTPPDPKEPPKEPQHPESSVFDGLNSSPLFAKMRKRSEESEESEDKSKEN